MTARSKAWFMHEPLKRDERTGQMVPQYDVKLAAEFGDIVFALPGRSRPPMDPETCLIELREAMRGFKENVIYLATCRRSTACDLGRDLSRARVRRCFELAQMGQSRASVCFVCGEGVRCPRLPLQPRSISTSRQRQSGLQILTMTRCANSWCWLQKKQKHTN